MNPIGKGKDQFYNTQFTFNKVPKLFLIYLVFQAIKIMNHFHVEGNISDTITPTTIMTDESIH